MHIPLDPMDNSNVHLTYLCPLDPMDNWNVHSGHTPVQWTPFAISQAMLPAWGRCQPMTSFELTYLLHNQMSTGHIYVHWIQWTTEMSSRYIYMSIGFNRHVKCPLDTSNVHWTFQYVHWTLADVLDINLDILYKLDSASLLVKLKPRIFQRLPPFE
jgi:hypothetical protein